MRSFIIILTFLIIGYAYNANITKPIESGCLTDELSGSFTKKEFYNLVERRKLIRVRMQNKLYRTETDTLYIPIVFHNYYQMNDGVPFRSFCDYVSGNKENNWIYTTNNKNDICDERVDDALEILNEQFASALIKFIPPNPEQASLLVDSQQSNYK